MDWFKKQKQSNWIIGLLVLINVITLISLWAVRLDKPAEQSPKEAQNEKRIMNFFRGELNLNETQAAEFKSTRFGHFEKFQNINSNISNLRREIMEAGLADTPDTLHIRRLAEQLGRLHADREIRNAEHFLRLRQICTPEQKEKFNTLMYNLLPRASQGGRRNNRERGGSYGRGRQNSSRPGRGYQNRQKITDSITSPDTTVNK